MLYYGQFICCQPETFIADDEDCLARELKVVQIC